MENNIKVHLTWVVCDDGQSVYVAECLER